MPGSQLFSYKTLVHAIAGSLASVTAMSATYPLDTIRARVQLDVLDPSTSSTLTLLLKLLREEGFTELYRGIVPTLESLCASNFVYFYIFHGLKSSLGGGSSSALGNLGLGAVAGVVNVLVTTPLWVVNTRIKLGAKFDSLMDGVMKVARTEGWRSLWGGTAPSLLLVLNPAIVFMIYETLKKKVKGGALVYFFLGAVAKCIATVLTYPLQIIQTKMRHGCGARSGIALLRNMIRINGFLSIYKGMEAKILQTVTTAALMFVFYEKIIRFVFRLMNLKRIQS